MRPLMRSREYSTAFSINSCTATVPSFASPCSDSKRRAEKRERIPPFCEAWHTHLMPDYRRNRVPGGTSFFTVNLLDRRSNLVVARTDALRDAVRQVRARGPFHIDAWVVLPDHMHCPWTPAFAGAGYRRKATPIFPVGGGRSRPRLQ